MACFLSGLELVVDADVVRVAPLALLLDGVAEDIFECVAFNKLTPNQPFNSIHAIFVLYPPFKGLSHSIDT